MVSELNETPVSHSNIEPTEVVTFGEWLKFFLLSILPFVGIILLFIWAFGSDVNQNKKNYARASLVFTAIFLGLYILFLIAMFTIFSSGLS